MKGSIAVLFIFYSKVIQSPAVVDDLTEIRDPAHTCMISIITNFYISFLLNEHKNTDLSLISAYIFFSHVT